MAIHHVLASTGLSLAKRASSREDKVELSPTAALFNLAIFLVFIPAMIWTLYTLMAIYPTLAIVEDPNPPAYEPVSLSDNVNDPTAADSSSAPRLVTSSFRSIHRLLQSTGGIRAHFRGLGCALAIFIAKGFVTLIFQGIPYLPAFIGTLVAMMALIQLYTAWVHIVITPADQRPFWKRLPPFKKTFEATVIPVAIFGAAELISNASIFLLAALMGLPLWDPSRPQEVPKYNRSDAWKPLVLTLVAIVLTLGLVYPAHVVLVRVQASLLPPDEDAILPFDRSFGGTIEPAVVSGKGYATWTNALKTFPRSSWIRLYKLVAKVYLISVATFFLLFVLLGATAILFSA